VHALLALARVEEAAGATEAADAVLAAAAAADPTSAAPLVARAKLAQRRGDASSAGALAARARQLAPQDPGPVEILAKLARKAMDVEAAAALYREASALAPGRPWAYVGLAQLRLGEGDLAGALSAVEEAEAGQGLSAELAAMLIELLRRAGEWPRALRTAREAAARWTDPWLQEQRVLIELCHAGPAAAAAALAELVRDNPSQQARHAHLAGLVEEAGWQIDAAHDHYRRALGLEPRREAALNDALRVALLRCDLAEALRHLDSLARLDAARRYRASHTLLGKLANEYALDRTLLEELVALRGTAPGERIPALHALVRDHPDATGPALQLLLALREAGPLGLRAPSAAGPIPRRICQYWPTPELPPDIAGYMASWERSHPDWPIQRFDDIRAHAWLRDRFPPALMMAFRSARTPGMRADLIRLAWLKAEGGFGAEAASRCLVPDALGGAEGIVPAGADLVLAFEETGAPGNGLIGAVPGHPLIDDALSRAVAGINRGDNDGGWLMTGPGLLARALAGAVAEVGGPLTGCHLLDRHELGRVVATQCHSPHGTGGPPARRRRRPPPPPG
jgi:Tfp pilus assembly protein PilF